MAITKINPSRDDTQQLLAWRTACMLYSGLGLMGAQRVADTAPHSGNFWIFHAITNCIIASITYNSVFPGGASAGDTIVAGDRIYGQIQSITLSAGTGELYVASMP